MAMNKREKLLAAVTGGLLLVVAVAALVMLGEPRSAADLRTQIDEKQQELSKLDAEISKCRTAAAKIEGWKKHALPWDTNTARNVYQEWLRQVCGRVHFDKNIDPSAPRPVYTAEKDKKEVARVIPYKMTNEVTLDQLTQFLHEFYSAGYMHKITSLSVTPVVASEGEKGARTDKNAKVSKENLKLAVKIDIEALALKDADAADKSKLKPERPPLENLDVYRKDPKGVVQRNLFAAYVEPPKPVVVREPPRKPPEPPRKPPEPPKPPEYSHIAENAFVRAITSVNGRPQVWLAFPTVDQSSLFLSEGESFQVRSVRGKIVKINSRDVVLDLGRNRVRVDLDHTLSQGVPVPP
jgi:hypothetical protein